MRRTLIAMLTVGALSVGMCIFSVCWMEQVTGEMDDMRMEVMDLTGQGRISDAQDKLGQMAEAWGRYSRVLEIIASHEDVHEIAILIIEGDANLQAKDLDDFNRSMALLGEAIDHLHEEERLRMENIL